MDTGDDSAASLLMRPRQNHYARILLDPCSSYSDEERRLSAPQIAVQYSPYLKFGLNGETVRYVRDHHMNNIESSISVLSAAPANFQSNRAGSSDDIIFYYELEILRMNENSEMCFGLGLPRFPVHKQPGFSKKARCSYGCNRNGEIKCSKIRAHSKLPSWTTGDIVGCGYNYLTNEIFFTKDQKQVIAFMGPSTSSRSNQLVAIISLSSLGDKVRVNFGQRQFKFNLRSLVGKFKNEFKGYLPELEDGLSDYKVVQEYLLVNGYFNTLDEFTKNAKFEEDKVQKKVEEKKEEKEEEEEDRYQIEEDQEIGDGEKHIKEIDNSSCVNKDNRNSRKADEDEEDVNIEVENLEPEEQEELQLQVQKEQFQDLMHVDVQQGLKIKNLSNDVSLKSHVTEIRRAARIYLSEGNEGALVDLLAKEFPCSSDAFSVICVKIRMRQFIRLCTTGSLSERIAFAQRYLSKKDHSEEANSNGGIENSNKLEVSIVVFDKKGNKEVLLTKEDVLGVFCYESISASPLKGILEQYAEERLWDEINAAILVQAGYRQESSLELACKQMTVIQQTMKEADMIEGTILNLV